jgi:hypothetical protein
MADGMLSKTSPSHTRARRACEESCRARIDCLLDAIRDEKAEGLRGGFFFENGGVSSKDGRKIADEFGIKVRIGRGKRQMSAA